MSSDGAQLPNSFDSRFVQGGTAVQSHRPDLPGQAHSNGGAAPHNDGKSKPLLQSNIPTPPALSLPTGGGAIRGMGEKFNVNSSNGTGTFTIPIKVPSGRSSLQPNLSLAYDSGNGNGEFGLGWRLAGVEAITRKTSKGLPRYNDHGSDEQGDVFLLAGSEDLVPLQKRDQSGHVVLDNKGQQQYDETVVDGFTVRAYAPRIVNVFNRIERWTNLTDRNDIHWRVISPDNVTGIYGSTPASRIYDVASDSTMGNPCIFSWCHSELYDSRGNAMTFSYKREDPTNVLLNQAHELNRPEHIRRSNLYLKQIRYGNTRPNRDLATWEAFSAFSLPQDESTWKYSVIFDYGEHSNDNPKPDDGGDWACRLDPYSRYNSGFEIRTYRICRRLLVFHHFEELGAKDYLVSSVDFSYDETPTMSYLVAAEQAGYSGDGKSTPFRKGLPPVEFSYSRFPSDDALSNLDVENVDPTSIENLPVGLDGTNYRWVDLDGEGISGLLAFQQNAWYYKRNTSAANYQVAPSETDGKQLNVRLGPLETLDQGPFSTASAMSMQFADVTGNGKLDLVSHVALQWGYYERNQDEPLGWSEFRHFAAFPNVQPDRTMQFIDLTGDGLTDILVYDDQVFTWYSSQGSEGYGPSQSIIQSWDEREGPVCVFADSEQCIYLADMSGDGLVDLCRIRNGDCCYWPQLGYGRFGRQICFDNAPWSDYCDQYDHARVKIADLDGSGTADILYLCEDGVEIYLNQSGNRFSDRKWVPLPWLNNTSAFNTVDLLGNGTQSLVCSSMLPCDAQAPMRYVDIFNGVKPHLLVKVSNNMGAETNITYTPSTRFYLEDKQNGFEWITRVHFPVQTVEKVETLDLISGNKFVSRYRYAHGFYDGVEREFRGFARVEQMDESHFGTGDASWDAPPIRTVSWFHTGAYFNHHAMEKLLAKEYFNPHDEPGLSLALDHTIIPPACSEGVQQMEACRALKGRQLRTEIYSDDGTEKKDIPYSIQDTNYTIVDTQPMQDAHLHGIYYVHGRETLSCHYERVAQDPRITHQITLEVDTYGNVRKDLRISYGRQEGLSKLGADDAPKQEALTVLYNEVDVTNSLDGKQYRARTPCDSRQYEIRGLKPRGSKTRFKFDDLVTDSFAAILSIPEVHFEDESVSPQRRLLRRERAVFKADDLSDLLAVGTIESLALPGAYHQLVFTPGLFSKIYSKTSPSGSLQPLLAPSYALDGKGYLDLDGDGHLWTASSKVLYIDASVDPAARELAMARTTFFLPKTFIDIFGNPYVVSYDRYALFPTTSRDAVGNTISAAMDYRALKPASITDPNGNVSTAAYDATGMVAGVAVSGKPSDNIGDTITGFQADLSQDALDRFLANPTAQSAANLLGNATSRVLYDPRRFKNAASPVYSAFISRETHVNFPQPPRGELFQVQITYSDGFGREIQVKTRTKPGPLTENGPDVQDRWVGSGWTVFNNKGKPVKQFEPFFDTIAAYQSNMQVGVSPISIYDALDRVIAIIHPDHSIEKTVYSTWSQAQFDANDTVKLSDPRQDPDVGIFFTSIPTSEYLPSWYDTKKNSTLQTERDAAVRTLSHADTPKTFHLDSLGRVFLVVTNTGSETVTVTNDLDILGDTRTIQDGLSRKSVLSDFDMCQRQVRSATIDSGQSWRFLDGADKECLTWNNRGFRFRTEYDPLRRQTRLWWQDLNATSEVLTSHMIYGEDYPVSANDSAEVHNLRGQVWQVLDQSGIVTNTDYDWDENLTRSVHRLSSSYKDVFSVSSNMPLEEGEYITTNKFDILRRLIRSQAPDGTITSRIYNQSTQLNAMYVNSKSQQDLNADVRTWMEALGDVQYNAKGQITSVMYGNGTTTVRTYDKLRMRLQRLLTTKNGGALQDLTYAYDPVGNVTNIQDSAQQIVFFRNTVVDPSNDYEYDALYRLVSASGREHLGQTNGRPSPPTAPTWSDDTHNNVGSAAGDGNAMGRYTETYRYDLAGNLLSVQHAGSSRQALGWTRVYSYDEWSLVEPRRKSNRLSQTSVGNTVEKYSYEGSGGLMGNITSMSHLPLMGWNFADQLQATSKQAVVSGGTQTPETTYYVYDMKGTRVRKVTESQAGPNSRATPVKLQERIYLGNYEIFSRYAAGAANSPEDAGSPPAPTLQRTTFHASTEYGHIADFCTRTAGDDDGVLYQARFQLHNHLSSAVLELSDAAEVLSYEEFFPFGSTSYRAVPSQTEVAKRYRYTGKELDSENGLYYFGARYYAAWLGRWTACDPVIGPGSRYDYASNNPIKLIDPDGRQATTAPGGGSGGGGAGWVDVPSSGVLGALVHNVTLAVLQERLLLRFPPIRSLTEYRTLPGGAKSQRADTTGEIDLAVLTPKIPTVGEWTAHVYELKPDAMSGQLSDYKAYSYQSETQHYSKYINKDLGPFGRITEAKPGGIIEDLDRQDRGKPGGTGILDPIQDGTPLGDVRINLRLQDTDSSGNKVRGLILYQVQVRPKNGKAVREFAIDALKFFLAAKAAQLAAQAAKGGLGGLTGGAPVSQPAPAMPRTSGASGSSSSSSSSSSEEEGGVGKWLLGGAIVVGAVALAFTGWGLLAEGGAVAGGGTAVATTTTVSTTTAGASSWAWLSAAFAF
ncbi:hypothetical protein LTR10_020253 [Elasticomyces elasticus]|uniref:Insecticide toxin TcdB middle/N-terminal domain-containing protein n=1 Tax=Exophiala sideris TaxID=1016849 RepID=A0ABR0IV47_9EURO|nr:hypothetical protein LTR10_020253 [Elasticomyces elasticus]KAK5021273.1 hypothetical protein LTS07_011112 [Exophiala sideris]KAK5024256.1 hypothetical protein LTR13_010965 [Exophiala sideris]KAK5049198.1 hypothetical protein LTR69_011162 [Exophiala sideris]KAK5176508.1 hypothetical protein LTR44_010986 [Eurotiomycetes sp. CCFEE 6388]